MYPENSWLSLLATACLYSVMVQNTDGLARMMDIFRAIETRPAQYYLHEWHNRRI